MTDIEVPPAPVAPGRSPMGVARGVLKTMRPRQWVKNVLVFAAPVVGGAGGAIIGGATSGPEKTNTTVIHEQAEVPTCTTTSAKSTTYGLNGAETTRTTSSDCP